MEVYTCDCGNQAWIITGDKIICPRCNKNHIFLKGLINTAQDFNKFKTTYTVKEYVPDQLAEKLES